MRIGILITHAIPPNSSPSPLLCPGSSPSPIPGYPLAAPTLSSAVLLPSPLADPLLPASFPVSPRRARGDYAVLTCRGGINTTAERIPLVPSSGNTSLEDPRPKSRARAHARILPSSGKRIRWEIFERQSRNETSEEVAREREREGGRELIVVCRMAAHAP